MQFWTVGLCMLIARGADRIDMIRISVWVGVNRLISYVVSTLGLTREIMLGITVSLQNMSSIYV